MSTTTKQDTFKTINPTTGKEITSHTYMTDDQVEESIQQSHKAFLKWKMKSIEERGEIIKSIGKELQNYKKELAELMTDEMGKLLSQSSQKVDLFMFSKYLLLMDTKKPLKKVAF
ncbi:aldehyde dehydrogenase family protein [Zobellia barbeyronii]|uniref:Aldehyde dehydrogenase family protein n=1 Tax=Zobellia barbeyronii TaxID=2748009 RepID=A0ABS5WHI0_9FLAO|nr:aldehyde dehydrogenase family protein [Zobellia barbeyronii]MBT2162874.1 aldehyde dehydrogenase family protein [Zobellia barbeyronii]